MSSRLARFIAKVDVKESGCWEWLATHTMSGYAMFSWEGTHRTVASRAAYRLFIGPIPDGYEVDHLCRNRGCVNPMHLQAITVQANRATRDVASGIRTLNGRKTHCQNGHPFSGDNLVIVASGERVCRTCRIAYKRAWREDRKTRGLPA